MIILILACENANVPLLARRVRPHAGQSFLQIPTAPRTVAVPPHFLVAVHLPGPLGNSSVPGRHTLGKRKPGRSIGVFDKSDMLMWLFDRQRTNQRLIQQREDRCVRADAQRQRGDGHQPEAGIFQQHSEAITQVLEQSFERCPAPTCRA